MVHGSDSTERYFSLFVLDRQHRLLAETDVGIIICAGKSMSASRATATSAAGRRQEELEEKPFVLRAIQGQLGTILAVFSICHGCSRTDLTAVNAASSPSRWNLNQREIVHVCPVRAGEEQFQESQWGSTSTGGNCSTASSDCSPDISFSFRLLKQKAQRSSFFF